MRQTTMLKPAEVKKDWYVVDATGKTLGRLATQCAAILRGKHKPTYTPNVDCGDYVIVINASKIKVTGKKMTDKIYFQHTGWIGNAKYATLREMLEKKPCKVIEHAVKGMLPGGSLGDQMGKKLYVYEGAEYKQVAQKPEKLEF